MKKLFSILNRLFAIIFSRPKISTFDQSLKYNKVLNNFIIKILYENMYYYIYNYTDSGDENKIKKGNYFDFINSFHNSSDEKEDYVKKFYKDTVTDCLVKMSPNVRVCFYRVYSGLTVPDLILYEKIPPPTIREKLKKNFLTFIKNFSKNKFNMTENEFLLNKNDMKNELREILIDAIDETEPGLSDYILKYINLVINMLAIEARNIMDSNKMTSEEHKKYSEEYNLSVSKISTMDIENIEEFIHYNYFILRYFAILNMDLLDDMESIILNKNTQ